MDLKETFGNLKRQALEKKFSRMNDMQKQAVFTTKGPLLILAGAGSGKTTVIVNRIAFMVEFGDAYFNDTAPYQLTEDDLAFLQSYIAGQAEDESRLQGLLAEYPVKPWNILAITFTNKAAAELKDRLERMLGETARDIQASTFHSACVRILRREIERLGYERNFTIYDTDDSVRVVKEVLSALNMSDKVYAPKAVLGEIGRAKDELLSPEEYLARAGSDYRKSEIAKIYAKYQQRLKSANAVDFDDIIKLTVDILEQFPDALEYYQKRFRYILVDEYQDTNHAQYKLVSLLSRAHQNLCVVGDDDQSIYKFRGATIENILSFEQQFENARVIRLEQNYRSTQNILSAANAVGIANNHERKGKNLWTDQGDGEKLTVIRVPNENVEAEFIASTIRRNVENGYHYGDHAILYRMNAQTANIERHFIFAGIPYRVFGNMKFFDRKEIRDVVAYLELVNNNSDNLRLKRIINEPKRGIGDGTVAALQQIADGENIPIFEVLRQADTYAAVSKKAVPLMAFAEMISQLGADALEMPLDEFYDKLLEDTGYLAYLKGQGDEGKTRVENVSELKTNIIKYMESSEEPSLSGFLEEIALYTDLDDFDEFSDRVVMMTLHSAKGLEFPVVFIAGMEEGIFPSSQSAFEPELLEEERRLAYVGITRAKKKLYLTNAAQRMIFGRTSFGRASRFISEIPEGFRETEDKTVRRSFVREDSAPRAPKSFNVSVAGTAPKQEKAAIDYQVGDTVHHPVFGDGLVVSMKPMGNDVLVEAAFQKVGTKKVMANFAKLKKGVMRLLLPTKRVKTEKSP